MVPTRKTDTVLESFSIDDVAAACRSAASDFVRGVRNGWTKRELAAWLVGPYHQISILRYSSSALRSMGSRIPFPRSSFHGPLDDRDLVRVMWDAREHVLDVVDRFVMNDSRSESFVWHLRSIGAITRVIDCNGAKGLVPNELAPQHLTDRVLSLVAVDYVSHPLDYEDRVAICRRCSAITFREGARETHDCGAHRMDSGIRPRIEMDELVFEDGDVDDNEVRRMLAKI